ncbi:hypothetical protein AcV7_002000 [Taiwanofungus camphoratus]|nr:hypothetical protein AcV7_002000 [Antrodia cinnamomea]
MRLRYRRCHYQCHHERTTRLGRLPGNSATLPLTPHGVVRHTDHHSSAALALRARGVETKTARQQWVRGSIVRDLQPPVERGVSRSSGQGGHLAFRTRPPLENEAEEKFKVFESRGDVDQGVVTTATGAGAEEPAKVEFCAGITPPPIQTGPPVP